MDKFLRGIITVERVFQILAVAGVILCLGYVGLSRFQKDKVPSAPIISPATQLK